MKESRWKYSSWGRSGKFPRARATHTLIHSSLERQRNSSFRQFDHHNRHHDFRRSSFTICERHGIFFQSTDIDINSHSDAACPTTPNQIVSTTNRFREIYLTHVLGVRVSKTPGNRTVYLHEKKLGTQPKCGDCGSKLPGVRQRNSSIGVACRGSARRRRS